MPTPCTHHKHHTVACKSSLIIPQCKYHYSHKGSLIFPVCAQLETPPCLVTTYDHDSPALKTLEVYSVRWKANTMLLQSIRKRQICKGYEGLGSAANRSHSPTGGESVSELDRGRGWLHNVGKCAKSHRVACFRMDTFSVRRT